MCLKKYLRFFIMTFCFLILNVNSCTCVYCNIRDGIKIRIHVPEFNILYIYHIDINDFVYMIWKTKIPHCRNRSKIQSKHLKNWRKISIPNIHVHDLSFSWLETSTSIKSGWVQLVVTAQAGSLLKLLIITVKETYEM